MLARRRTAFSNLAEEEIKDCIDFVRSIAEVSDTNTGKLH